MKLGIFIKKHPEDMNGVLVSFMQPHCKAAELFNEAVDNELRILDFTKKYIGSFNDFKSMALLEYDLERYLMSMALYGEYKALLKRIFDETFNIIQTPLYKHTISKTKFIGCLNGKDYYLRKNVLGEVIDIRHSDKPSDYTTWSIKDIDEYYNRDESTIIDIIHPKIYSKVLPMLEMI